MEDEEEVEGDSDPASPATGFGIGDALVEFEEAQAEEATE